MEKEIIKDADIEEVALEEKEIAPFDKTTQAKKRQRKNWVLLFVLGVLIGITVKQEASRRIVIGFDDYRMKFGDQNYSINAIEKELRDNPDKQKLNLKSLSAGGNCQQQ